MVKHFTSLDAFQVSVLDKDHLTIKNYGVGAILVKKKLVALFWKYLTRPSLRHPNVKIEGQGATNVLGAFMSYLSY